MSGKQILFLLWMLSLMILAVIVALLGIVPIMASFSLEVGIIVILLLVIYIGGSWIYFTHN